MKQFIVIVVFGLMLSACSSHDEAYYLAHPKALAQALRTCHDCADLHALGAQLNQLGYELQVNQQQYGQTILSLQQARQHTSSDVARQAIDQQLQLRLAVVNWLASPGRSG
jgi:hypothetical protein